MPKIEFNDVGEVDLEELGCYVSVHRSDISAPFTNESGSISEQRDEVELRFKNGETKVTTDLSGIMKLDTSQVSQC